MKSENYENLKQIATHYGYEPQSRQLIEAMAELTQAINKKWRFERKEDRKPCDDVSIEFMNNQLIEEIADVEICLEQIKYLLDCNDMVEQIKDAKIVRQLQRIKNEKR